MVFIALEGLHCWEFCGPLVVTACLALHGMQLTPHSPAAGWVSFSDQTILTARGLYIWRDPEVEGRDIMTNVPREHLRVIFISGALSSFHFVPTVLFCSSCSLKLVAGPSFFDVHSLSGPGSQDHTKQRSTTPIKCNSLEGVQV